MEDRDLHPLERALLAYLSTRPGADAGSAIADGAMEDEGSFRRASQWLLSRGLVREASSATRMLVELGPLGRECLEAGAMPETILYGKVRSGVSDPVVLQSDPAFDAARWGSALGALLRTGAVEKTGEGLKPGRSDASLFERVWTLVYRPLAEGTPVPLDGLPGDVRDFVLQRSPKRGRGRAEFSVTERTVQVLEITPEGRLALETSEGVLTGALTSDMLADGSWRKARFRRYSLDMPPARIHAGRLHPYRQFLDAVRRRFLAMGFKEMRGSIAESEFWNCDALFMPQFHPARDIHDVYFLDGCRVEPPEEGILERVARTHKDGWESGSRGWGYDFSTETSRRTVLRSQGTALSARTLASGPDVPGMYFAIARCFRYDQVDATHLPDFFQVEGIVLGRDMDLRHLLGLLGLFAAELAGAGEYRCLPAYFPFTEPSVELFVRHPSIGWMELGGAGLFRPEVTAPLGVDVPVIAWGLGLDRMAMVAMGLSDIRDLMTGDLSRLRSMRVLPDRVLGGGGGRA
ncbi:phenylalanine--tRNA ligase subunit alpha [Candidatus Fermentibacteria bacterium]|nr:phenylalanine--tRNA ligase subunit alpha [Candidatus Fermentibacteria bacterium]